VSHTYGSLCISATTPQQQFPQFEQVGNNFDGSHTPHRFRGHYQLICTGENHLVSTTHIPQRSKSFLVATNSVPDFSERANARMAEWLPVMEGQYEDARQLYKFNELQKRLKELPGAQPFTSTIVNRGEHGHFGILSQWKDVHTYGVYDTQNFGVRFVWTTDEWFINDVKSVDFTRYVFYRFPVLQDRPLFIYSQAVCSKWYGWMKIFKGQPDCILRAFCSLENYLFKEAELRNLQVSHANRPAY
jgi:hypothetical protein